MRDDEDEPFVPVATHKLVGYAERGVKVLPPEQVAVFEYVERVCDVPSDFEANHAYGPKSGVSFEERLIGAYVHGLLDAPDDAVRRKLKRFVTQRRWGEAQALVAAAN